MTLAMPLEKKMPLLFIVKGQIIYTWQKKNASIFTIYSCKTCVKSRDVNICGHCYYYYYPCHVFNITSILKSNFTSNHMLKHIQKDFSIKICPAYWNFW